MKLELTIEELKDLLGKREAKNFIKRKNMKPRLALKRWTKEEDARVKDLLAIGKSYKEISKVLGRSEISIKARRSYKKGK
mgnify:CR=1 FL=1